MAYIALEMEYIVAGMERIGVAMEPISVGMGHIAVEMEYIAIETKYIAAGLEYIATGGNKQPGIIVPGSTTCLPVGWNSGLGSGYVLVSRRRFRHNIRFVGLIFERSLA